jgi:excisionase family DNA binding protein
MQSKRTPENLTEIQITQDPLALLDVEQTCEILKCSRGSVYNLIRSGELISLKILSSRRLRRLDVERYIVEQLEKSSSKN